MTGIPIAHADSSRERGSFRFGVGKKRSTDSIMIPDCERRPQLSYL